MEESKFFSCLNFRTWGEVSEMVTGISEVNEGGEMGGEVGRDMEEMVYYDLFRMVLLDIFDVPLKVEGRDIGR